ASRTASAVGLIRWTVRGRHSPRDSPRKNSRTASSTDRACTVPCRIKYACARHSAVTIRGTSIINFRLSSHPCVPLVQWLKRHSLCRCCDRQGEHYNEKPHHFPPRKLKTN